MLRACYAGRTGFVAVANATLPRLLADARRGEQPCLCDDGLRSPDGADKVVQGVGGRWGVAE